VIVSDRGSEDAAITAKRQVNQRHPSIAVSLVHMPSELERGADCNDILIIRGAEALRAVLASEIVPLWEGEDEIDW
jgi:hypothetical protein